MKKLLFTTALAGFVQANVALAGGYIAPVDNAAHPALMLGIAFEFGDTVSKPDIGLTAKLLSSNKPDKAVVGGGVTYFPWAKEQFGVDLDIGYVVSNGGLLAGYDFLRWKPQFSAGYVQTDDGTHCPAGYIFNGSGSCTINAPSDRRLKRNIKRLATLAHGIKLYSFNYLWSDTTYVGVMAQDLLADARWADAVHIGSDGFYCVDYQRLGLRMITLDSFRRHGLDAVYSEAWHRFPALAA